MIPKPLSKLPNIKTNHPLKAYTTFKIGGPAKYFYKAQTPKDLIKAVKLARESNTPFYILGNGSNILISDRGFNGLVIKNQTSAIKVLKKNVKPFQPEKITPRYQKLPSQFKKLEYPIKKYPQVLVKINSGVLLQKAIYYLINQKITGLEWFAGIPASIGGAAVINIHGGHKFFSDYLYQAEILTPDNQLKTVNHQYFNYDYDYSSIPQKKDIILSVVLRLFKGPKKNALKIAQAWSQLKSHQPQQSAGCIFQNLSLKDQKRLGLPTNSIGYIIDQVLKLKNKQIGQARIADKHAGFIQNLGKAQSEDVLSLIKLIKQKAKNKLNLNLKLEIVLLGFNQYNI